MLASLCLFCVKRWGRPPIGTTNQFRRLQHISEHFDVGREDVRRTHTCCAAGDIMCEVGIFSARQDTHPRNKARSPRRQRARGSVRWDATKHCCCYRHGLSGFYLKANTRETYGGTTVFQPRPTCILKPRTCREVKSRPADWNHRDHGGPRTSLHLATARRAHLSTKQQATKGPAGCHIVPALVVSALAAIVADDYHRTTQIL